MAQNGIFFNGVWSIGLDFLPNGAVTPSNIFDAVASGSTGNVNATFAATSGKGIQLINGTAIGRTLQVNLPTLYLGFHFATNGLPSGSNTNGLLVLYDSVAAAIQCCVGYNNSGQIGFYGAGGQIVTTSLGNPSSPIVLSAAGVLVPNAYPFIEILATISPTNGVFTLRVNGVVVATFTGNTRKTANAWVNNIFWGSVQGSSLSHQYDNIYILDTTGAAPLNTFLGPGRIQTDGPNGESATPGLNAWTPTNPQGTDYGNCANIPLNAAQFNQSATIGQRMSLAFPAIANAVQALFLNTWYSAKIDTAGVRSVSPIFRSNSVDQVGAAVTLSTVDQYFSQPSTIDPNTGNSWAVGTVGAVQTCEIGLEVIT